MLEFVPVRFQSTLPGWGATASQCAAFAGAEISIHAPRMGSDVTSATSFRSCGYFNPRSPDGERPGALPSTTAKRSVFQSTLPGWGATALGLRAPTGVLISIHAPRMGSDHFPRSEGRCAGRISIHAPRMGSDMSANNPCVRMVSFQSTLPGWGATPSGYQ